ncbi:hypothetical protein B0T25DRAFT_190057 [Lasiosphaeria hispida]|uniref:Uncharacterized protein n=1 Tax=Lasiosphaeria hispida TaxID=260671 RepID=A0AAJ0HHC8_9PEZI|nr:hypothetical protein B0T25DRAFT_190057 [Lasiosphaeria hispida]
MVLLGCLSCYSSPSSSRRPFKSWGDRWFLVVVLGSGLHPPASRGPALLLVACFCDEFGITLGAKPDTAKKYRRKRQSVKQKMGFAPAPSNLGNGKRSSAAGARCVWRSGECPLREVGDLSALSFWAYREEGIGFLAYAWLAHTGPHGSPAWALLYLVGVGACPALARWELEGTEGSARGVDKHGHRAFSQAPVIHIGARDCFQ